ncbi:MAG: glycerate kinase [Verrucomicrobiaceae bacterium]|nr:glycerate kinase [Verrucomicrobiaceae bacterium]
MRILVAMDKFKGSLTAAQAGEAVRRGLLRVFENEQAAIDLCPVADGGEGTTDAVVSALGGEQVSLAAHDAQWRPITAHYGIVQHQGGAEAVMEMSATAGLAQVSDLPLDPAAATTHGTGVMMRDALARGVKRIVIGIGGSATNDGGIGMAQALGFVFRDAQGREVEALPAEFESVERIERAPPVKCEILVACDVRNPLLGAEGATRVYGPQKGVRDIDFFEARLTKLADLVARDLGTDFRDEPGAGAAGGLGFGLMSFCGARLVPGFDLVASITGLEARLAAADLIITGEGRLDGQTLHGKGPAGVAALARSAGKKCIALAGVIEPGAELSRIFDLLLQTKPAAMEVSEAMRAGARLLEEKVVENAGLIRELVL